MNRLAVGLFGLTLATSAWAAVDSSASYPNRPVRMITGSPGSTSDIAARFVAQKLSERWGQQVVV
ncbi:MAG TPA: tripartite tricarboxylate transporter substrate binding protein, partial [Burkholderiales bacterium]|nr:tripartite tricarboxylate transporter substrate binding protein [Burkholderiales bacterium]